MKTIFKNRYLVLIIFILYLLTFNILSYNYFLEDFKNLEIKENKKNLSSLINKIDNKLENIYNITNDYAKWDKTYDFILTKDKQYIYDLFRSNSNTLADLGLDFMIFQNLNYETIYSNFNKNFELKKNNNEFITQIIQEYNKEEHATILTFENRYFYTVKASILKSDSTGKIRGYLFAGKEVSVKELDSAAIFDKIKINPKEEKKFNDSLNSRYLHKIDIFATLKDKDINSYLYFYNHNKQIKFSLKVSQKKEIYIKGQKQILIFNTIISSLFIVLLYILYIHTSYQEKLKKELHEKVKEEIDKQRKQEQLLIQQSKLAAMGEMIGNIAHQWRQPLNALGLVMQNIQFAYNMGDLDDKFMEKSINKANILTSSMSKTIDDFRNFFKPNKTKEYFKINKTVKKAIYLIESTFEHNYIEIEKDFSKEDIEVYGFANEFSQSILNILSNAKDALIEKRVEDAKVKIRVYKDKNSAIVQIEDNAKGISKDIKEKIFEPYFTTKEEGKGTGIGLYMTKTIIENSMGGEISVENTDLGACFTICVPLLSKENKKI
ncbi:ATP-binding protein [Malaciobacter marinus]|uniref:sensor histidine kinase n=1 Tax=Malaciobacter marinus TaxID=505249 RepID=UPI0009A731CF|nr:ATP-binding protein [Malaciobacter marinus]SKB82043.1 CHASE4 domain-containing protein [Malaciobacter marinus]